jgi:hypothetical protein
MKADTPGNKGPMKGEIVKGGVVVPTYWWEVPGGVPRGRRIGGSSC